MKEERRENPTFDELLSTQLEEDPEFRHEWELSGPAAALARALRESRQVLQLEPAALSELTGLPVERLEEIERIDDPAATIEEIGQIARALRWGIVVVGTPDMPTALVDPPEEDDESAASALMEALRSSVEEVQDAGATSERRAEGA